MPCEIPLSVWPLAIQLQTLREQEFQRAQAVRVTWGAVKFVRPAIPEKCQIFFPPFVRRRDARKLMTAARARKNGAARSSICAGERVQCRWWH